MSATADGDVDADDDGETVKACPECESRCITLRTRKERYACKKCGAQFEYHEAEKVDPVDDARREVAQRCHPSVRALLDADPSEVP